MTIQPIRARTALQRIASSSAGEQSIARHHVPEARTDAGTQGSGWLGSLFLGLSLVFVYLINGRELGTDDTFAASLLPLNILRGEGVYLENRRPGDVGLYGPIPFSMGDLTWAHRDDVSARARLGRPAPGRPTGRRAGFLSSRLGPRSSSWPSRKVSGW